MQLLIKKVWAAALACVLAWVIDVEAAKIATNFLVGQSKRLDNFPFFPNYNM